MDRRVYMTLRGEPDGPRSQYVSVDSAMAWHGMIGRQVKLDDGQRAFITSAALTFDILSYELSSIDVQVTFNP